MPSPSACKKQIQRSRRLHDPRPLADFSLADIRLYSDDCLSAAGKPMLMSDNLNNSKCIILFGTDDGLAALERSQFWYIDGTFDISPDHFVQLVSGIRVSGRMFPVQYYYIYGLV